MQKSGVLPSCAEHYSSLTKAPSMTVLSHLVTAASVSMVVKIGPHNHEGFQLAS